MARVTWLLQGSRIFGTGAEPQGPRQLHTEMNEELYISCYISTFGMEGRIPRAAHCFCGISDFFVGAAWQVGLLGPDSAGLRAGRLDRTCDYHNPNFSRSLLQSLAYNDYRQSARLWFR